MDDPLRERLAAAIGPGYQIQRLLGRGGMGSVYLARETALDRLVAVKVLPPDVAGDPESRERFRREARTAARLTHPHIVPLHAFGEGDGLLWFVMGYVAGETLAAKLERTSRPDPDLARRVLGEVALALDHAHGLGIVHRDVKPENILIDGATGKALLADFGVARAGTGSTTLTTAGALVGTPLYMSPEQAAGERDLDGRSDLYSLATVGYRMLAGRTPFEAGELRAVIAAHITQPPAPLPPDVPSDLARVVMRGLAKAPDERWSSGQELHRALAIDSVISDEELDRLGSLPSFGFTAFSVTVLGFIAWAFIRGDRPWSGFWADRWNILVIVPVAQLLGFTAVISGARRRLKRPLKEVLRIAFWPPAWWNWPWPAHLRRPGDLWPRLPQAIQRLRSVALILIAAISGFVLTILYGLRVGGEGSPSALPLGLSVAGMILAEAYVFPSITRLRRKLGFNFETAMRLMTKPTWNNAFWKRPEIAALLSRGSRGPEPRQPGSPAETAAEIRRLAQALPAPHGTLGSEAARRAAEIAARVARMDEELAALAAEVRPADLAIAEKKLGDLGVERVGEPEVRRAIRAMHEQQIGILRRLTGQLEEAQARRDELAGMLRTLHLQISELKIAASRLTEADTSGVRAIIEQMSRQVEGLREVG